MTNSKEEVKRSVYAIDDLLEERKRSFLARLTQMCASFGKKCNQTFGNLQDGKKGNFKKTEDQDSKQNNKPRLSR